MNARSRPGDFLFTTSEHQRCARSCRVFSESGSEVRQDLGAGADGYWLRPLLAFFSFISFVPEQGGKVHVDCVQCHVVGKKFCSRTHACKTLPNPVT